MIFLGSAITKRGNARVSNNNLNIIVAREYNLAD